MIIEVVCIGLKDILDVHEIGCKGMIMFNY